MISALDIEAELPFLQYGRRDRQEIASALDIRMELLFLLCGK